MLMRLAVACFALYCVHGAQNSTRDVSALAEQGATLVRETGAQAPRAALGFCFENATLCSAAVGGPAPSRNVASQHLPVEGYPQPPRRPAAHKKA